MTLLEQFVTGIFATLAMTLFTEVAFAVLRRPYRVVKILGGMLFYKEAYALTAPSRRALTVANILHYAIGIIFTWGYTLFVAAVDWEPQLIVSVGYGFLIGLVAIVGWRLFFKIHPAPPALDLPTYLVVIGLGHIVLFFNGPGDLEDLRSADINRIISFCYSYRDEESHAGQAPLIYVVGVSNSLALIIMFLSRRDTAIAIV